MAQILTNLVVEQIDTESLGCFVYYNFAKMRPALNGPALLHDMFVAAGKQLTDEAAIGRYRMNSIEKPRRTASNEGHVSSWQTRDVAGEPKRYGGGIVIQSPDGTFHAIGVSGFSEWADEAMSLTIAVLMNLITKEQALGIAEISQNPHFGTLILAAIAHPDMAQYLPA